MKDFPGVSSFLGRARELSSVPSTTMPAPTPTAVAHPAAFWRETPSVVDLLAQRNALLQLLEKNKIPLPEILQEVKAAPILTDLPPELLARIIRLVLKDTWKEAGGSWKMRDFVSDAFRRGGPMEPLRVYPLLFGLGVAEVLKTIPIDISLRPQENGISLGSIWVKKRGKHHYDPDTWHFEWIEWMKRQPRALRNHLHHLDITVQLGSFNGKKFDSKENAKMLEKAELFFGKLNHIFPKLTTVSVTLDIAPSIDHLGQKVASEYRFKQTMKRVVKELKKVKVATRYVASQPWYLEDTEMQDLSEIEGSEKVADKIWKLSGKNCFKI